MKKINHVNHFLHAHLLKILLFMYGVAALFPKAGVAIKTFNFGTLHWAASDKIVVSLPLTMLSFLLFNAGFSVRLSELKKVIKVPAPLLIGLLANVFVPLLFTIVFSIFGKLFWHNPDEVQNVLVGLAIIASMPIAGSSTTWVQNAGGNPALILGLVVCSTIFSPFLSPMVFHVVGNLTTGDYSEDLHELATQGVSSFLIVSVVVPSLSGIIMRVLIGENRWRKISPFFKASNLINLLILNYSNASTSLPVALKHWDPDFLAMILFATTLLCLFSFSVGWIIPKLFNLPNAERVALTFGLGMNNNGTGLVLASSTMGAHPLIMLPIIFYNLGQQVVAGIFNSRLSRRQSMTNSAPIPSATVRV